MAAAVTLRDLLSLAIGSPELGAVNFSALHSLLLGLLEHLQVGDVRRILSAEEEEFIQPAPVSLEEPRRPATLFHQLQSKVAMMEARLLALDALPTPGDLLQGSQSQKKPVEDMWQLMQLRRKVESNEDGVTKAMSTFQELLSTFLSLRQANSSIQERLASLSDQVIGINIQEMQRRLQELEEQAHNLPLLTDRMENLQKKLSCYPEPPDLVTWPSLHDTLSDKSSSWGLSSDIKQQNVKKLLSDMAALPGRQQSLEERVRGAEEELQRLGQEMSTKGVPEDLLQQLRSLRHDVEKLFKENKKDKMDLKTLQNGFHELNVALQQLETRSDKLAAELGESATLQSQLDELEKKKLNRDDFMRELNLKAEQRALEGKVGHAELEAAMLDVNAVLEDLIRKLAVQEAEWQNMLEKLLAGLEAKLSRSDLDSVQKDLEELWRFLKKYLSSGQALDPDGAAGFRRKLFERVKCISCDRPVTMATAPYLVTVRSAALTPRPDLTERNSGGPPPVTEPEFQYSEEPRPHTACSLHRRPPHRQSLTTVFPYGDPTQLHHRNSRIDLLGIDGMMYKGSLDGAFTPDREATVRTPQPPYRLVSERARSATPHHRSPGSPATRTPAHPSRSACSTLPASPTFHVPSATQTHPLQRAHSSEEQRTHP